MTDREYIPSRYFSEAYECLKLSHEERRYADALYLCEVIEDDLHKLVAKFSRHMGLSDCDLLLSLVIKRVENLILQEVGLSHSDRAFRMVDFLTAARRTIRCACDIVETAYQYPLIPLENVQYYFRYPYNHLFDLLIGLAPSLNSKGIDTRLLTEFRTHMLDGLRKSARDKDLVTAAGTAGVLLRYTGIYMLTHQGSPDDIKFLEDMICHREATDKGASTDNLFLTRAIFVGRSIMDRNPEISEKYLYDLKRNQDLSDTDILVDAIHYGDVFVTESYSSLPGKPSSYERSLSHVLRHLSNPEQYPNLLNIHLYQLNRMLEDRGPSTFGGRRVITRLHKALRQLQEYPAEMIRTEYLAPLVKFSVQQIAD